MNQYNEQKTKRDALYETLPNGISSAEKWELVKGSGLFDTQDSFLSYSKRRKKELMQEKGSLHIALEEECEEVGIPVDKATNYWYKGKHFSIHVKNNTADFWAKSDGFIEKVKNAAPIYDRFVRTPIVEPHCLVLDAADIHLGKLSTESETGDGYSNEIALNRVKSGINGVLHKSQPYNIDKIFFIVGNDVLHTDTKYRTTTKGTAQDTDGMWYDNFNLALDMYVEAIEACLVVSDVKVVFNPSNHDYQTGFFLAQTLKAYFNNCSNIEFDVSIKHRKYFSYGNSLIGTTHGDGAKSQNLPLLMANESGQMWVNCKYKHFYVHHTHHKFVKDYAGVTVETVRSITGTDSYHHIEGYQHVPKAIEGFIHSQNNGRVSSIHHHF